MIDLVTVIQDCGPRALGIVSLISFLIGLILGFVGAVQLEQFGASIYVAALNGADKFKTEKGAPLHTDILHAPLPAGVFVAPYPDPLAAEPGRHAGTSGVRSAAIGSHHQIRRQGQNRLRPRPDLGQAPRLCAHIGMFGLGLAGQGQNLAAVSEFEDKLVGAIVQRDDPLGHGTRDVGRGERGRGRA